MKDRIICVLIICILGFVSYRFFFQKSDEEIEFKKYMEDEYTQIFEIEESLGESYKTAVKKYAGERNEFIQDVNDKLLIYSQELVDTAESIDIKSPELKRLHNIYLDAVKEENEALKYFEVAKDKMTPSLYSTAWDKISNANSKKMSYFSSLEEMAESHHMKYKLEECFQDYSTELAFGSRTVSN